jgi:hypothetical protein
VLVVHPCHLTVAPGDAVSTQSPGLSPEARGQLAVLEEARRKWEHIRALIEQASARKSGVFHATARETASGWGPDRQVKNVLDQARRMAADVGQMLAEHRLASLAEEVNQLVLSVRPSAGMNPGMLGAMREIIGSVTTGIELAEVEVRRRERKRNDA